MDFPFKQLAGLDSLSAIVMAVRKRDINLSARNLEELLHAVEMLSGSPRSHYADVICTLIRVHLFGVQEIVFQTVLTGEIGDVSGLDLSAQMSLVQWLQGRQSNESTWEYIDELRRSALARRTEVKQIVEAFGGIASLLKGGALLDTANLTSLCRVYRTLQTIPLPPLAYSHAVKALAAKASHTLPSLTTSIAPIDVIETREIFNDALSQSLDAKLLCMFAWDKGALELSIYPTNKVGFNPLAAVDSFRVGLSHAPLEERQSFEEWIARALCEVSKSDPSKVDEVIDALSGMRASLEIESLFWLGKLLTERFAELHNSVDAEMAIQVWNDATKNSSCDSIKGEAQANLATVLELLADGNAEEEQRAIILRRRALPLLQDNRAQCWTRVALAKGLLRRFNSQGKEQDREELRNVLRDALESDVLSTSTEIALELLKTYVQSIDSGLSRTSDESKRADSIAGSLLADSGLSVSDRILVHALRKLIAHADWELTGNVERLEDALQHSCAALDLAESQQVFPPGCSHAALLQSRAICYLSRYGLRGDPDDLHCAREDLQQAISLSDHPGLINSQAVAVLTGHESGLTNSELIEKAIQRLQAVAQDATTESRERVQWSLANLLLRSYLTRGIVGHLHEAIDNLRGAIQILTLAEHPLLALSLAQALYNLFLAEKKIDVLNEAITLAEDAIECIPADDPTRWSALLTLANAFQQRFVELSRPPDSRRAEGLLSEAMSSMGVGAPYYKAVAATLVGLLIEQHQFDFGENSLERAADLAERIAPAATDVLSLDPQIASNMVVARLLATNDEQEIDGWLRVLDRLSRNQTNAEGALIAAQNWLHQAYGASRWQEVAAAYERICIIRMRLIGNNIRFAELETILRRFQNSGSIAALALVAEGKYANAAHLLDESQATLLRGAVASNADRRYNKVWENVDQVWYIASTQYGGFAVKVSADGAHGVLLPEVTRERVGSWCSKPFEFLPDMGRAVLEPLKGSLGLPQKLVLVPIGALSSLPWSAVPIANRLLLDWSTLRVAPSMDFLESPVSVKGGRAVLVEVPDAPGHRPLSHATAEVTYIGTLFPGHRVLRGAKATQGSVIDALCDAEFIHFACHGLADAAHPAYSSLLLGEGNSLTVEILARLKSASGHLAFLSACETANGGQAIPDEFANIAAAFLAAGFKGSVGALTKVNDVAASILARRFYWHFVIEGESAADALRCAQMWLRDSAADEVCKWLNTLGLPATSAEEALRTKLSEAGGRRIFADPKYWATYVYYGG